ncbi:uncharacterized protein LOC143232127 isoform X2 [Tachypleus tridentatus]|uniref:uncharacterized protein LOC143232127 isoform X2 n=1 Tax=Tachypleus tridentatus TaxID=6853 RepID=UPI003FCEE9ED
MFSLDTLKMKLVLLGIAVLYLSHEIYGQTAIPREVENLLRKHGLYTSQAQTTLRKVLINSNVKAFPSNVLQQLIEIFKLARKLPESEALLEFLSAPLSAS